MPAKSVAETGAKPGDSVRCVKSGEPHRFKVGQIFTVVSHCGNPCVRGNSDYKTASGDGWSIPWAGYGAEWEVA